MNNQCNQCKCNLTLLLLKYVNLIAFPNRPLFSTIQRLPRYFHWNGDASLYVCHGYYVIFYYVLGAWKCYRNYYSNWTIVLLIFVLIYLFRVLRSSKECFYDATHGITMAGISWYEINKRRPKEKTVSLCLYWSL